MRRGIPVAITSAVLVLAAVAPAGAQTPVVPVAPVSNHLDDGAPVLADGRVVFAVHVDGGRVLDVRSAPVAGGPVTSLGRVRLGTGFDGTTWSLAGSGGLGVVVGADGPLGEFVVLGGPAAGPLTRLPVPGRGGELRTGVEPTTVGPAYRRYGPTGPDAIVAVGGDGRRRIVARFTTGDQGFSAPVVLRGGYAAVGLPELGRVDVHDLATGRVQRRIRTPRAYYETQLDLGPDGTVVTAGRAGIGRAGPADTRVTPVVRGVRTERLATDGARIAYTSTAPHPGVRVRVIDAAEPGRTLSVGPLVRDAAYLRVEGDSVAYSVPGCVISGSAVGGDAGPGLPAGPCVRTQLGGWVSSFRRRGRRVVVRVRLPCLAAPDGVCRVGVRALAPRPGVPRVRYVEVDRTALRIRAGSTATARLRVRAASPRAARVLRREIVTETVVHDPDDRSRRE